MIKKSKAKPKPKSGPKIESGVDDAPVKKKFKLSESAKKKLKWIGGGFIVFLILVAAFSPHKGSKRFGICKVLIEMNEPYPKETKIFQVDDNGQAVRIYYSNIGTFGEHRSNIMDCSFEVDKDGNVLDTLEKVDLNGKKNKYEIESAEYIKKFNVGVPAILANPPDLTLPWVDLDDLKIYWEAERRE